MSALKAIFKQIAAAGGDTSLMKLGKEVAAPVVKKAPEAIKARQGLDTFLQGKVRSQVSELIDDLNLSGGDVAHEQELIGDFKETWSINDDVKFDELLKQTEDVDLFGTGQKKRNFDSAAVNSIMYHISENGSIKAAAPEGSMMTKFEPTKLDVTMASSPENAEEFAVKMTGARQEHIGLIDAVKARYLSEGQGKYPKLFSEHDLDTVDTLYGRVRERYSRTIEEYPIGQGADKRAQRAFTQRSMYRYHNVGKDGKNVPVEHWSRSSDGVRKMTPIYNEVLDREVLRAASILDHRYDVDAANDVLNAFTKYDGLNAIGKDGEIILYNPDDPNTFQALMSRYHDVLDAVDRSMASGRQPFDLEGVSTNWDTTDYGLIQDIENGLSLDDLEFRKTFNKLNTTLSEARNTVAERFATKIGDSTQASYLNRGSNRLWYEGGIDSILRLHDEALAEYTHLKGTEFEASAKAYYQATRDLTSLRGVRGSGIDEPMVLREIDFMSSWQAESEALKQISKFSQESEAGRVYQAAGQRSGGGMHDSVSTDHLALGGSSFDYARDTLGDIKVSGEALKRDMAITPNGRGYDQPFNDGTDYVYSEGPAAEDNWLLQNGLSRDWSVEKEYLSNSSVHTPESVKVLSEATMDLDRTLSLFGERNWQKGSPRALEPEVLDSEEALAADILDKKAAVGLLQRFPLLPSSPRFNTKPGWNVNILRMNTVKDFNGFIGDLSKTTASDTMWMSNADFRINTGLSVDEGLSVDNRDLLYKAVVAARNDILRSNDLYLRTSTQLEDKLPALIIRDKNLAISKVFQDRLAGKIDETSLDGLLPEDFSQWDMRAQDPVDFSRKVSLMIQEQHGSFLEDLDLDFEDALGSMLQSLESQGMGQEGISFAAAFKNSPAVREAKKVQDKANSIIISRLTKDPITGLDTTTVVEKQGGQVKGAGIDYLEPEGSRLGSIIPGDPNAQ